MHVLAPHRDLMARPEGGEAAKLKHKEECGPQETRPSTSYRRTEFSWKPQKGRDGSFYVSTWLGEVRMVPDFSGCL